MLLSVLVVDTGVLVAAADRNDPAHHACADLLLSAPTPIVTTGLVVAKAAYLIQRELGVDSEVLLFRSIAEGAIQVLELTTTEWARVYELVAAYGDLPLGGTDASVIVLAERLEQIQVAKLDYRHFSVVRPAHCVAFELVP